ncbi:DUF1127 domain-containing protein [Psychromarinibacter halotolerans]|uniref:DUF1127 domain-containing protein n=1 Tax=Psychromarinibacter halotolerans TaxID=1775175 RepID=A0ABV7GM05_9RHOB|nr:DUF1127 domain-containing protein [Psychromarinibacter halotolerans]MAQ84281.1 hypothetical protein [Maritimibacter sp.]MDF0597228.1 DUF1127 domain-containing protein [Psychromarinibacter halotolerans]
MTQHVQTHAPLHGATRFAGTRRRSVLQAIFQLSALRRQRLHLAQMDARMLDDIGVSRDEAMSEASRPVWDAPGHWTS